MSSLQDSIVDHAISNRVFSGIAPRRDHCLDHLPTRAARFALERAKVDVGETFGNRFVLVWHERRRSFRDAAYRAFWRDFARVVCNAGPRVDDTLHLFPRERGVNADFRVIGGDGRVVTHCANGLIYAGHRCRQRWQARRMIFHCGRDMRVVNMAEGVARVNLGRPRPLPRSSRPHSFLSQAPRRVHTGEPHAVSFAEDLTVPERFGYNRFFRLGHAVCRSEEPHGINWNLVGVTPDGLRIQTFERGVRRPTKSCGTGSAAALFAAREAGRWQASEAAVWSEGGCHVVSVREEELFVAGRPTHQRSWKLEDYLSHVAAL